MSSGGPDLEHCSCDEVNSSKHIAVESPELCCYKDDDDECSVKTYDMLDLPPERRELAKAVILHDYPLSIIDHMGFKDLLVSVYAAVSQDTLNRDINKIYEFQRNCSRALFYQTESRLAVTTHKWIACDKSKRYISLTGHIIDDNWNVQRRMIRFLDLPYLCSSDVLAKITIECLSNWEFIPKNLSTIAIENSSPDVTLSEILTDKHAGFSLLVSGKLSPMQCFACTVSSMIKDALAVIDDVIKKIRNIILFWTTTQKRERQFKETSRDLGIKTTYNHLVLDFPSKWNTTFSMIQTSLLYKTVFCQLKEDEPDFSAIMLCEEEWKLVEETYQKLEVLYTTINRVSKYQTANLALLPLSETKVALSKWVQCDNVVVRNMASKMLEKFDKYWHAVRDTFVIATMLDPRLQLDFVSFCFEEIYGDETHSEVESIHQIFYDLFDEYKCKLGKTSPPRPGDSATRYEWYKWRNHQNKKRKVVEKHEFDRYAEYENSQTPGSIENFDILGWWKIRTIYPTLQKMARDILAIPILSVPPENMFDIDESVLSSNRSRIDPTMVETLMCTQSWLWTDIKGSYSITNSYSWGTSDADVAAAAEEYDLGEEISVENCSGIH